MGSQFAVDELVPPLIKMVMDELTVPTHTRPSALLFTNNIPDNEFVQLMMQK